MASKGSQSAFVARLTQSLDPVGTDPGLAAQKCQRGHTIGGEMRVPFNASILIIVPTASGAQT
jgi:hypothetical protein